MTTFEDDRGIFGPDERVMMRDVDVYVVIPSILERLAAIHEEIATIDTEAHPAVARNLALQRENLTRHIPDVF